MTYSILAFDTSGPHIAAAVWPYDVQPRFEATVRGQAERLMPICEELIAEANIEPGDLDAVAVGIGPGNFTGVRIAVSAARGMALALRIPAIGVSGFEMLHQGRGWSARVMVSLPAPRDQVYVQTFLNGMPLTEPRLTKPGIREPDLEQPNLAVAGYRAREVAEAYNAPWDEDWWEERRPDMMASNIACIAANKLAAAGGAWRERPAPLYVRPADATPSRQTPPRIIG